MVKDYYAVLGISHDADGKEIRRVFRKVRTTTQGFNKNTLHHDQSWQRLLQRVLQRRHDWF